MFGLIKSYDMLDNMFSANIYDPKSIIDGGYEVTVKLSGLSRSDIDVSTLGQNLTVTATREFKGMATAVSRQYKRTWTLPEKTNFESISARYEAGILKIHVPVKKENKRKIEVE